MLPKSAENISANECWRGATSSGLGQATSPSLFLNGFAMHRTPVPRSSRWAVEVLKQHARQDQPEGHGQDDQKCRGAVRRDAHQQSYWRTRPEWREHACSDLGRPGALEVVGCRRVASSAPMKIQALAAFQIRSVSISRHRHGHASPLSRWRCDGRSCISHAERTEDVLLEIAFAVSPSGSLCPQNRSEAKWGGVAWKRPPQPLCAAFNSSADATPKRKPRPRCLCRPAPDHRS